MDSCNTHDYGYDRRKAEFKRQYMKKKRRARLLHNSVVIAIRLMIVVIIIIAGIKLIDYLIPSVHTEGQSTLSQEPEINTTSVGSQQMESNVPALILVNAEHKMEDNILPLLVEISHGIFVDTTIVEPLNSLISKAKEDGISLTVVSGYRTSSRQEEIYNTIVEKYINEGKSEEKAATLAEQQEAKQGYSEHHTGLCVDFTCSAVTGGKEGFETSNEYSWLLSHCSEYGFILRYPEGKENETGMEYNPYHFRYVGKAEAQKIMEENLCLEEYLKENS